MTFRSSEEYLWTMWCYPLFGIFLETNKHQNVMRLLGSLFFQSCHHILCIPSILLSCYLIYLVVSVFYPLLSLKWSYDVSLAEPFCYMLWYVLSDITWLFPTYADIFLFYHMHYFIVHCKYPMFSSSSPRPNYCINN